MARASTKGKPDKSKTPYPKIYNDRRVRRSVQFPDELDAAIVRLTEAAQARSPDVTYSDVLRRLITIGLSHAGATL